MCRHQRMTTKVMKPKRLFCFSATTKTLMSRQQIKSELVKFRKRGGFYSTTRRIPIQFAVDPPVHYQVKVRPYYFMTPLAFASKKPLIPALFQMAALADDPKALPALKSALGTGQLPLHEAMLDAEKLDAVLKAIARKRKPATRRS
jgi:hypothetical protein